VPKKAQITQERVEYNVFLFDEPLKGSKSLKIFKISLTFRFDKLSNLSKSVHTGEYSQILTVLNKKLFCYIFKLFCKKLPKLLVSPERFKGVYPLGFSLQRYKCLKSAVFFHFTPTGKKKEDKSVQR
jgi:hypothetical protein